VNELPVKIKAICCTLEQLVYNSNLGGDLPLKKPGRNRLMEMLFFLRKLEFLRSLHRMLWHIAPFKQSTLRLLNKTSDRL
jgi:hypothetical protein